MLMRYNNNMKKFWATTLNRLGWIIYALTVVRYVNSAKSKVKDHLNDKELFTKVERYKIAYKACDNALKLFNIKVIERGFKNVPKRPVLFVSNHKSNFDAIVMNKILFENEGYPFFNFISKSEVQKEKYAGAISQLIDCIFIDRKNPRDIIRVLEEAKKNLNENSIIVYPEGTRITEDRIGEMNGGAIECAYQSIVPIVPIVIYGTNRCTNKNKKPNYRYKEIIVEFLPQIKPKNFISTNRNFLMKKIEDQISKRYQEIKKEEWEKLSTREKERLMREI